MTSCSRVILAKVEEVSRDRWRLHLGATCSFEVQPYEHHPNHAGEEKIVQILCGEESESLLRPSPIAPSALPNMEDR